MHHTVNILKNLIEHNQIFVYTLIYLGLVVEGELVLISCGVLLHLGALNFSYSLLFMLLGVFSKTFLGYVSGLFLRRYHDSRILKYLEKKVLHIMPHFKEKPFWSIFISKFIFGANNIVVIFSGFEKINFKQYLKAEAISTLFWAPIMVFVGYFFSYEAIHATHSIGRFVWIIFGLIITYIVLDWLITWLYEIYEEFIHKH